VVFVTAGFAFSNITGAAAVGVVGLPVEVPDGILPAKSVEMLPSATVA
jgi:hypothetical protein